MAAESDNDKPSFIPNAKVKQISIVLSSRGWNEWGSDEGELFFRVLFWPIFLERGTKRRQFFWSPFSKHFNLGNFVRSVYYLVQFLCFGVYFSPILSRIGYHLKAKILEPGKKISTGIPCKFRSSAAPPPSVEQLLCCS